jgi:hypothetical protein
MLSNARPGNSIVTLPAHGGAEAGVEDSTIFGTSGSAATVTGTRAALGFDLRGCNSPRSYCRFQRNTWLAFTPFARAIPATLAPGSSVSFTILSFSSIRRNTRRFRPDAIAPSMRLSWAVAHWLSRWEDQTLTTDAKVVEEIRRKLIEWEQLAAAQRTDEESSEGYNRANQIISEEQDRIHRLAEHLLVIPQMDESAIAEWFAQDAST